MLSPSYAQYSNVLKKKEKRQAFICFGPSQLSNIYCKATHCFSQIGVVFALTKPASAGKSKTSGS